MPLCGKTTAVICGLISTWGVVQLALLGLSAYLRSPALIEDISIEERESWTESDLKLALDTGYQKTALNCWIASLLYFTALCASAQQFWANHRIGDDQFKATQF
ncbi:ribonuclease kappa isoform X2 [Eurytemora carolleeae]|nr:ribonuclease kappa isoform X2 [Eurytemora carolleeae]XP_023337509.1 ribonuclease kappa isoform X2 [Eurytemora carolleeae]|eukprot:XP_023337508.1 ribonuclease kappa-like isoform X2 [Eurytemora affinis]